MQETRPSEDGVKSEGWLRPLAYKVFRYSNGTGIVKMLTCITGFSIGLTRHLAMLRFTDTRNSGQSPTAKTSAVRWENC
jgi:hypothetical protein